MPAYEILKSEKNRDVLLVEGFLFWFDRATPKGRKYWKCIYCYRGYDGDVKNKCLSRVITSPNDPVAIICKNHNHSRDTVLVEHMKAYGSIRRLASSLRNPPRKISKSPETISNSSSATSTTEEDTPSPSTSEPLDLSIASSKRPSDEPSATSLEPKPKKVKRALADVLETLYNRLQIPPQQTQQQNQKHNSSPLSSSSLFMEKQQPKKELEMNLSFQKPIITHVPTSVIQQSSTLPPPKPPTPKVIDLSVTGQPGLANPNLPFRFSSSWLALAAMSNLITQSTASQLASIQK